MNAIDTHQQFKYEFISGISLSNDLHHSNQIDTNKERQIFQNKFPTKQNSASFIQSTENKQLEIVGLEFGSKTNISISPKFKLSKPDQTILQIPKRTTFLLGRKAQENILPRTWTSSDKLSIFSSNRRMNTTMQNCDEKSIEVQRTQSNPTLNSSITVFKKMPNNNQLSPRFFKKPQQSIVTLTKYPTSLKLPSLLKRTPATIVKPIPSAYIQDTPRIQATSSTNPNRPVLQPTQILPIYTPRRSITLFAEQQHLPLIKDRMIKANLAQKARFKCKSPLPYRPDSSLSRSTTAVVTASQLQLKTYNPLKHMDIGLLLNDAARNRLKRLFQQLDTDKDGHLTYPQVQKCLPVNLPRAQETFFRVLYDITSDTTYFGLQEFYATAVLVDMIDKQDSQIWSTLLDDVDFNYYHDDILELLDEFDSRYSPITSTINFDNLIALIMNRTTSGKYETISKEFENVIPTIKTMKFTRLEFIALIPVIIYIESRLDHGKSLFRFKENSILDLHMQRALLT